MAWVQHPDPDAASSEFGRQLLRRSLARNQGELGMAAAAYTFPELGDNLARIWETAHFGRTALPNVYKDLIATLVSTANACQY